MNQSLLTLENIVRVIQKNKSYAGKIKQSLLHLDNPNKKFQTLKINKIFKSQGIQSITSKMVAIKIFGMPKIFF